MAAPTLVTFTLSAEANGVVVTRLVAAMDKAQVPADLDTLALLGCTIASDNTARRGVTNFSDRVIVVNLNAPPLLSVFKNNPLPQPQWLTPTGFQGSIASSSDQDGPGGSGSLVVAIDYKDASGGAQTEAGVTLKGRTRVNLTNQDKVLITNIRQTSGGALVNAGVLTIYSGTTSAKIGTSVAVATLPQPPYRLVTTPDGPTLAQLFRDYMKLKLATAIGTPILAAVPVFA